jgi:hypothetical protein
MAPELESEGLRRQAAQKKIIVAGLARGLTFDEAGELAGVVARTIGRWRKEDPVFDQAIVAERETWVAEIVGGLAVAGIEALNILRFEARFGERSADRVRAAVALLNQGQRFRREANYEVRMRKVEERLGLVEPLELATGDDSTDPEA